MGAGLVETILGGVWRLTACTVALGGVIGLPVLLITWLIGWTPWWYLPLCAFAACCGAVCTGGVAYEG